MNSSGNAVVAWISGTSPSDIAANIYSTNGGWGTATIIDNSSAAAQSTPAVGIDSNGNALVAWDMRDSTQSTNQYSIMSNRYSAGSWGTATSISGNQLLAMRPHVVFSPNGSALALWEGADLLGTGTKLFFSSFNGSSWVAASAIETLVTSNGTSIGVDGTGNAMLVYGSHPNGVGVNSIYAKQYVVGSGWGGSSLIETSSVEAYNQQVVVELNGNATAIWQEGVATSRLSASRYTVGSGWSTPVFVDLSASAKGLPALATNASGTTIAVWGQVDGTSYNVYASQYSSTSGWSTPTNIENLAGGTSPISPDVAVDTNGNALVVWGQDVPLSIGANVYASRLE